MVGKDEVLTPLLQKIIRASLEGQIGVGVHKFRVIENNRCSCKKRKKSCKPFSVHSL